MGFSSSTWYPFSNARRAVGTCWRSWVAMSITSASFGWESSSSSEEKHLSAATPYHSRSSARRPSRQSAPATICIRSGCTFW